MAAAGVGAALCMLEMMLVLALSHCLWRTEEPRSPVRSAPPARSGSHVTPHCEDPADVRCRVAVELQLPVRPRPPRRQLLGPEGC